MANLIPSLNQIDLEDAIPGKIHFDMTADWNVPPHVAECKDYGKTQLGGRIVFGFKCTHCQASWRHDYRTCDEFNVSVSGMLAWFEGHHHHKEFSATVAEN
jgi:hypothetical protein